MGRPNCQLLQQHFYHPPPVASEPPPEETATPPQTSDGGAESPSTRDGISVFHNTQPPYGRNWGGSQICLTNNPDAANPTWPQLIAFLTNDKSDQKDYHHLMNPCGAFAEEVHNNAEASGIRAAWVAIHFADESDRHALNAFNTVDRGLIFVDCTSVYRFGIVPIRIPAPVPLAGDRDKKEEAVKQKSVRHSCDKIAYVVVGKEYGAISLDVATSPDYSFYEIYSDKREEYSRKLEAYNQEVEALNREIEAFNQKVDAYNQALGGRKELQEPEYSRFMAWADRLKSEQAELDTRLAEFNLRLAELDTLLEEVGAFYWEPGGVVSKIEIYW